jgi:sensor histidine kinase YesM
VKEMKKQTQFLSSVLARQFDKTLELYIEDIERLSLAIFTDPIIQNSLTNDNHLLPIDQVRIKKDIYPRLFNQAYPRANVENISLYTLEGTVYEYTRNGDLGLGYIEDEAWMDRVNQIDKSDFLLLPTTYLEKNNGSKEFVIPLVRNIYHLPQRYKIGAMKILINVQALNDLLQLNNHHELEKYMRIFVIDDDGAVIYDNKDEITAKGHLDIDMSIFSAHTNTGNLQWEGEDYLYSFEKSNYTDWNTTVLISNEFIVDEQYRILRYIVFIGLFSIALIAILSYFLAHHITKPIRKLMTTMRRVKQGKLNERINFVGNVETDLLSNVYNDMLDSINKLIKEVYESKLAEKDAKILALQSQINPHFLYNTLNIMKSISRVKGVEEVAEISESLASLFKYSMKQLNQPVSLSDEIEHVQNYMKIQHHRFGNRFILTYDIPEHILHTLIPKLTIQPLIENAVKHGLNHVKGDGLIKLRARNDQDLLIIQIIDNGKGMSESELYSIRGRLSEPNFMENEENGIGLINIQQRIQLLYGTRYCVKISSIENEGTIVELEAPFITKTPIEDV